VAVEDDVDVAEVVVAEVDVAEVDMDVAVAVIIMETVVVYVPGQMYLHFGDDVVSEPEAAENTTLSRSES